MLKFLSHSYDYYIQNPSDVIMEVFQDHTEDLQCTARSENSVIAEVYRCVNGTGILLDNCRRGQSTHVGRVRTSCSVTVDMENVSETFFCVERALFDQMNRLSAHFSVGVQGSSTYVTNCHFCKFTKFS